MLPTGAEFAFTIVDDTDDATVANAKPIYDLLTELGLRTTKTAWPLEAPEGSDIYFAAETLEDPGYREFVANVKDAGFEIASHGATMESSRRERTIRGLQTLARQLDVSPVLHCNHGQNAENVYWGAKRYRTRPLRAAAAVVERVQGRPRFSGEHPASPYFWGDICRETFEFVRSFTFPVLDISGVAPVRPYTDPTTPYVRSWFCTADAPDAHAFRRVVTREAVDKLRRTGGVALVSTHLGKGFVRDGVVDPGVRKVLEHIASLPGWFAPATDILRRLRDELGEGSLSALERWRMELAHLYHYTLGRRR